MRWSAFSLLGKEGSSCTATARLVRGPVATRITCGQQQKNKQIILILRVFEKKQRQLW